MTGDTRAKQVKTLAVAVAAIIMCASAGWLFIRRPGVEDSPEKVSVSGIRPGDDIAEAAANYLLDRISAGEAGLPSAGRLTAVTCLYPTGPVIYSSGGLVGEMPGRPIRFRLDLVDGESRYIDVDMRQTRSREWAPWRLKAPGSTQ